MEIIGYNYIPIITPLRYVMPLDALRPIINRQQRSIHWLVIDRYLHWLTQSLSPRLAVFCPLRLVFSSSSSRQPALYLLHLIACKSWLYAYPPHLNICKFTRSLGRMALRFGCLTGWLVGLKLCFVEERERFAQVVDSVIHHQSLDSHHHTASRVVTFSATKSPHHSSFHLP